jgi:two-component system chemotaxis sensor kinase CheA
MDLNQYLSIFIDESREHLQAINENMLKLERRPKDLKIIQNIFRSAHTLKGMSATMGYEELASLTHEMENVLDLIRNGKLQLNESIFDILFKSLDVLEAMIDDISAGGTGKSASTEILGKLQSIFSNNPNFINEIDIPKEEPSPSGGSSPLPRTIRVDIDRIDSLMSLLSELLIDRVRLEQLANDLKVADLSGTVEHLSRITIDFQNIILKLRMVSIDSVFNRFPRMVRDLARALGKKAELLIIGADTELDRSLIDVIGDSLVHLLRNALDHGIETVDERIAAGKSEIGTIQLRAFHSENHVCIEIEDDGRGIDKEKVLMRAVQKGIITEKISYTMEDHQVYQLLFTSGFSTADKVSDISGRGVGLDVVKTKIGAVGGCVTVNSTPGAGTKFSVRLPLSFSIVPVMLIKLGQDRYAIPLSSIIETKIITMKQVRRVEGREVIDYRSEMIPLISLKDILMCGEAEENEEGLNSGMRLIIVRTDKKMAALRVDEFSGQQEIVLKSIEKYLDGAFAISSATILGDGNVALVIDTNALLDLV